MVCWAVSSANVLCRVRWAFLAVLLLTVGAGEDTVPEANTRFVTSPTKVRM